MKILLAVDGSDYSKRMLAWLAAHDDTFSKNAELTFLTVVPSLPPHVTRYLDEAIVESYYRDRAEEVLGPIAEFARRHGWRFETRSSVGRPGETIAETATAGAYDLVVMGSHGHSALGALVLGSVVQRVLSSCRTPVQIIR
jgi:nucleotide-binding universal stress UspA family protein